MAAASRKLSDVHPSPTLILDSELSVLEAAALMGSARTDAGIVQDPSSGALVGILTDSDVSIKVIAGGLSLRKTTVGEAMTPRPLCAYAHETAAHALSVMAKKRARHLPLVDGDGAVYGMLDITRVLFDAISRLEQRKKAAYPTMGAFFGVKDSSIPTLAVALEGREAPGVCGPRDPLVAAFEALKRTRRSVLVLEDGALVGILSKSDIAKRALQLLQQSGGDEADLGRMVVSDAMTPRPDHISSEKTVLDALHKMHDGRYSNLPVLDDDGSPVAVVDVLDLLNATPDSEASGGAPFAATTWLGDALFMPKAAAPDAIPTVALTKLDSPTASPSSRKQPRAVPVDESGLSPESSGLDDGDEIEDDAGHESMAPLPVVAEVVVEDGPETPGRSRLPATAEVRCALSTSKLKVADKPKVVPTPEPPTPLTFLLAYAGREVRVEASTLADLRTAASEAFGSLPDAHYFEYVDDHSCIKIVDDRKLKAAMVSHHAADEVPITICTPPKLKPHVLPAIGLLGFLVLAAVDVARGRRARGA